MKHLIFGGREWNQRHRHAWQTFAALRIDDVQRNPLRGPCRRKRTPFSIGLAFKSHPDMLSVGQPLTDVIGVVAGQRAAHQAQGKGMRIAFTFTNKSPYRCRIHFYNLKGTAGIQGAGRINDFSTQPDNTAALSCGEHRINRQR